MLSPLLKACAIDWITLKYNINDSVIYLFSLYCWIHAPFITMRPQPHSFAEKLLHSFWIPLTLEWTHSSRDWIHIAMIMLVIKSVPCIESRSWMLRGIFGKLMSSVGKIGLLESLMKVQLLLLWI